MSYLRDEAEEWGSEVGSFIRRNPLPVALVGLGLGWLTVSMLRGGDSDEDVEYIAGPEGYYGPIGDGELASGVDPYSPERGSRGSTRGQVSSAMHSARDEMAGRASHLGERIGHLSHDARHRLDEFTEAARDRIRHVADDTRERASHWTDATRGGAERVQHQIVRAAEERPLVLGAIGIGLGALIGFCLPSTRAESRLVGHRRDELIDEIKEAGKERLHGLAEAARETGAAVRDQAEKEGLGRGGARENMDKAQRVAETAMDTARNEAENRVVNSGPSQSQGHTKPNS